MFFLGFGFIEATSPMTSEKYGIHHESFNSKHLFCPSTSSKAESFSHGVSIAWLENLQASQPVSGRIRSSYKRRPAYSPRFALLQISAVISR